MKKVTSLQILAVMVLIISSYNNADSGNNTCKFKSSYKRQPVIMSEEEQSSMLALLDEGKARRIEAMGKTPTEHSIKKYIDKVVAEFNKSNKDMEATERALMKLGDARVAIREFTHKLKAVDSKHTGSSVHSRSLHRKFKHAAEHIEDNGQFIQGIDDNNFEEDVEIVID